MVIVTSQIGLTFLVRLTSQIGLTFLVHLTQVDLEKRPLNNCIIYLKLVFIKQIDFKGTYQCFVA